MKGRDWDMEGRTVSGVGSTTGSSDMRRAEEAVAEGWTKAWAVAAMEAKMIAVESFIVVVLFVRRRFRYCALYVFLSFQTSIEVGSVTPHD
jgi:hypothetical protein